MTRQAFRALDCRDYARIDFRLNREGQPYVLEINALPNLMPKTSSYAVMARKAGLTFSDLIRTIVFTAQMRYGMIG
jgi:D-alanine-D-alanine ligase and related ATP-grasp enzymes